ncbi:methylmalonyl Co-A mutase-associated GTPase MeaB [Opitutaceae bacterium EW11]|nr:methylmalonyl Co-A mutase-associated GTPase MeaB [Opitutaceae bacterium EW11]
MPNKAQREHCQQPRPDWVPEDAGPGFATWVLEGVNPSGVTRSVGAPPKRRTLSIDDYVDGIKRRDTAILARAITLVESNAPAHQELGQELLARIMPMTGAAMRVGITGIPGVGKSTFIEALGSRLCDKGRRVAVLAVDPSSSVTGGSILGDKMRMEKLSRHIGAFIRPSPSAGSLGGVARKSREAMLLCEAAGYDVVIVETVGVGQNEVTVRSMVDCFVVLMIAGAGDEVQGMKKGVIELADLIVVNKADGENKIRAMAARAEMARVLHYLKAATEGWPTPALLASAMSGEGISDVWKSVEEFFRTSRQAGVLDQRRRSQAIAWMHSLVNEALLHDFYENAAVKAHQPEVEREVADGKTPALAAARRLLAFGEGVHPDAAVEADED